MPPILQLDFGFPEPADERLEALLAEELARERSDPSYGLTLIQLDSAEVSDAA